MSTKLVPSKNTRVRHRTGCSRYSLYRQLRDQRARWQTNIVPKLVKTQPAVQEISADTVSVEEHTSETAISSVVDINVQGGRFSTCYDSKYCVLEEDDDDDVQLDDDTESSEVVGGYCRGYDIDMKLSLGSQLARWVVSFRIAAVAFTVLLKIFRAYRLSDNLPTDSRTVMQTARCVVTKAVSGGEYFHFGLAEGLTNLLNSLSHPTFQRMGDTLKIMLNMDGLPCFKSVNTHVWPILCSLRFEGKNSRPFTVGVFYGVEKDMSVHDFLCDFVKDYNECRTSGFSCRGRTFKVKVLAFVCDAPARAFIKNVKPHSARQGCERCTVVGVRLKGVTFNDDECPARTNATFRNRTHADHHKGPSPLEQARIKMISQFVLDYMHLILLGVMRRLLCLWFEAEKTKHNVKKRFCRLYIAQQDVVDARLLKYAETCPSEFARKPRSLKNKRMWKATELRTFLLYTGIFALQGTLEHNCWQNFKLLMCAMRICLSSKYSAQQQYRKFAKNCLRSFVKQYRGLYGKKEVVYNVHNVLHLHKDVKRYGNLDSVSAFPFENHLQSFKRMIRSGSSTIQQVVRRVDESQRHGPRAGDPFEPDLSQRLLHFHDNDLPRNFKRHTLDIARQCKTVVYHGTRFSIFDRDSCIRLPNHSVGQIVNILSMKDKSVLIMYREYVKRWSVFDYPCNSEHIGISLVDKLSTYILTVDASKCKKAWLLPRDAEKTGCIVVDLL